MKVAKIYKILFSICSIATILLFFTGMFTSSLLITNGKYIYFKIIGFIGILSTSIIIGTFMSFYNKYGDYLNDLDNSIKNCNEEENKMRKIREKYEELIKKN